MRTNEEFRAEVYRRRNEALARKKAHTRNIISALICLPLGTAIAFIGLSLAIAMTPAGSGDKNAPSSETLSGVNISAVYVEESDGYKEALLEFFAEIEARTPQEYPFDVKVQGRAYKVHVDGKIYFVCESYMGKGGNYFALTADEFAEFLSIIGE